MGIRIQSTDIKPNGEMLLPALRLLQYESDIRELYTEESITYHLTNQIPEMVECRQVMLFRRRSAHQWELLAITGTPNLHNQAPLVVKLQQYVQQKSSRKELHQPGSLKDWSKQTDILQELPDPNAYWVPFKHPKQPDVGVLVTSELPLKEQQSKLLERLTYSYQYTWEKVNRGRPFVRNRRYKTVALLSLLTLAVLACLPIRLNVLAPVEVIASDPYRLTSPMNGVVKAILVPPNTRVSAGQPLVQFEDITARNELKVAEKRLAVAQARAQQVRASAFTDREAARQLAIVQSEYQLALTEYQYAQEVLSRTRIIAATDGLVIYSDRRDWEGRPVQVGEEILQLADPSKISYRIDLPTANNIAVSTNDDVSIYLDNAPFGGSKGSLVSVSYQPRTTAQGITAYTLIATPADTDIPRIGARGTARIYGEEVTLFYQLTRRPIASVRKWLGI